MLGRCDLSEAAPRWDVVCLGEVVIDMVPINAGWTYVARAGGAAANVATGLAERGHRVAMLARTGDDPFGDLLHKALEVNDLSTELLQRDPDAATGLAIVARADQTPPFVLYREETADTRVTIGSIDKESIRGARHLHLGSLLSTSSTGLESVATAVAVARDANLSVSADVNLRPSAWSSTTVMVTRARELIDVADVVKVTVDELEILGLGVDQLAMTDKLWLVTDGENGASIVHGDRRLAMRPPRVDVVDTTGAGDASLAGLLNVILGGPSGPSSPLQDVDLSAALNAAVIAGARAVGRAGAMAKQPASI